MLEDAFTAEIRIVPYSFAPSGWAFCDGQLLNISQNMALYSLLGNYYGGDGTSTFALPNFRGSVPVGAGQGPSLENYGLGQTGGAGSVALTEQQIPYHTHFVSAADGPGSTNSPVDASWAEPRYGRVTEKAYSLGTPDTHLSTSAFSSVGQNQPHNNMPPYLALNFIICLTGTFPPQQ
jgi:microcystin-dependent protein